jgi:hypothetical protein
LRDFRTFRRCSTFVTVCKHWSARADLVVRSIGGSGAE